MVSTMATGTNRKAKKRNKVPAFVGEPIEVEFVRGKGKIDLSPHYEYIRDRFIFSAFQCSLSELVRDLEARGEKNIHRNDLFAFKKKLMKYHENPAHFVDKQVAIFDPRKLLDTAGKEITPTVVLEENRQILTQTLDEIEQMIQDEINKNPEGKEVGDLQGTIVLIQKVKSKLKSVFLLSKEMYRKLDVLEYRNWIVNAFQLRIANRMELEITLGMPFKDTSEDLKKMSEVLTELKKDKQDLGLFPKSLPDSITGNVIQNNLMLNSVTPERNEAIYAFIRHFESDTDPFTELP
jgi:hypothetical protein